MVNKDNIIEDEFHRLKEVGEFLKFMQNAISNSDGNTPFALEETVLHLSRRGIESLNEAMTDLSKKFPGNEFKPIALD